MKDSERLICGVCGKPVPKLVIERLLIEKNPFDERKCLCGNMKDKKLI